MIAEIVDDFARAYVYAKAAHAGQKRLDGSPYIGHPLSVAGVLCEAGRGSDTALLCAALLHDVVEDTATTQEYICMCFGDDVADLVERVTNKPGKNRAERHKNTYPRIKENGRARVLKYADRLANIRSCCADWHRTGTRGLLAMYAKENDAFMRALKVSPRELMTGESYLINKINSILSEV